MSCTKSDIVDIKMNYLLYMTTEIWDWLDKERNIGEINYK